MELFLIYFLALAIFCVWHFGIRCAVKDLFVAFLAVYTRYCLAKAANENEKKIIDAAFSGVSDFIYRYNLKQVSQIISSLRHGCAHNSALRPPASPMTEEYNRVALGIAWTALKSCTGSGFFVLLFYLAKMLCPKLVWRKDRALPALSRGFAQPAIIAICIFMAGLAPAKFSARVCDIDFDGITPSAHYNA